MITTHRATPGYETSLRGPVGTRACVVQRSAGNPMSLAPGRLRDLVEQARTEGSFIICHETLPYADPPPGVRPAICRGFHDRYDTAALQIVGRLWGFVDVDPPTPDQR